MLIDWFTVVAQIINFLVLLVLLKWLLFDRVVRAMDQREEKIATRLNEAQQQRHEVEHRAQEVDQERDEIRSKREGMLESARQEADEQQRKWLREAREQIDRKRDQWQRDLAQRQQQMVEEFGQRASDALLNAMQQALRELADADLQRLTVQIGRLTIPGLVQTFGERPVGETVALFGSTGNLIVSVVNGSAAGQWGIHIGDPITVSIFSYDN